MSIKPKLPGGFRDYLPEDQMERNRIIEEIRSVFENFGFSPLSTPAVERKDILTGGDPDFDKQIFKLSNKENKEPGEIALRFDLTVPLARVISAYSKDIKKPAKLYQFGRVWRGERQQAGRYREFLQCDADIVGSSSPVSDAEIVAAAYQVMKNLGVGKFLIHVSNRKILNGLCKSIGLEKEKAPEVFRAIDKLKKQGWEEVEKELGETGLQKDQINKIKEFIFIKDGDNRKVCEKAEDFISDFEEGREGIEELKEMIRILEIMEIPPEAWKIDFSIVRGLGYYTGMVFETYLTDIPELGSVASGGRYDNLVERFGIASVPAVGFSVGFDRLYEAMKEVDSIETVKGIAEVIVLNFEPSAEEEVIKALMEIREAGIRSTLYLSNDSTLKGQFSYAVSEDARAVVIIGKDEIEKETVIVKDLLSKQQEEIPREKLVEKVREILK